MTKKFRNFAFAVVVLASAVQLSACCAGAIGGEDIKVPANYETHPKGVDESSLVLVDENSNEFPLEFLDKKYDSFIFEAETDTGLKMLELFSDTQGQSLDRVILCGDDEASSGACNDYVNHTPLLISSTSTDCAYNQEMDCHSDFTPIDATLTIHTTGEVFTLKGGLKLAYHIDYVPAHASCISE